MENMKVNTNNDHNNDNNHQLELLILCLAGRYDDISFMHMFMTTSGTFMVRLVTAKQKAAAEIKSLYLLGVQLRANMQVIRK